MGRLNRTFRSYLLSYMVILLIPTMVLTFFVFNYFLRYSTEELLSRNVDSVSRIQRSVDMQVAQLDAYASQISTGPAFSTSVLQRSYAAFYDVIEALHNWELTSPLEMEVFLYNMQLQRVYASGAVYTVPDFLRFGTRFTTIEDDALLAAIADTDSRRWIPAQDNAAGQRMLTYLVPVFWTKHQTTGVALFLIDTKGMDSIIDNAVLTDMTATFLCDGDGTVLYAARHSAAWSGEDIAQALAFEAPSGYTRLGGQKALYVRQQSGNGLTYLTLVPLDTANAPILRLQRLYYVALGLVLVVGCIIIIYGMRSHYRPIRELGRMTGVIAPAQQGQGSEVDAAMHALASLWQSNRSMRSTTSALGKEKMILMLLMGGFPSAEAFRQESGAVNLDLAGDVWRVMLARVRWETEEGQDYASRVVARQREVFSPEYTSLFVEFPETNEIVFIVSGAVENAALLAEKARAWKTSTAEDGITLGVVLGDVCTRVSQLHAAYMTAKHSEPEDSKSGGGMANWTALKRYPADLMATLWYAISVWEEERVLFAVDGLIASIRAEQSQQYTRHVCYGALQTATDTLRQEGRDVEAFAALQQMLLAPEPMHAERGELLLRRLAQTLLGEMTDTPQQASAQLEALYAYINENAMDPAFYVKGVADHFNMSVSNLSHYFKNHAGVTLSDYIENLRMERATELLAQTRIPIAEIAASVGYLQPTSFMRKFKQRYGVTPGMYRRRGS